MPVEDGESAGVDSTTDVEELLPDTNILIHCVYKDLLTRLQQCFEGEDDPHHNVAITELQKRDESGKSPLELASMLGRAEISRELITRGAEVNTKTAKGYTALHLAAAWGKANVLKTLVELGADLHVRNAHTERARDIALRYSHTECVDFLDWAEARASLVSAIKEMQETIADPEKVQGRLAKEEKSITISVCREKTDWLENTPEVTTQDLITQKHELEDALAPILLKLSEPVPEKK